ncbi:hypothetical protein [Microbacterium sp. PM5]|uniref:hypothetical protein n=1 Tax=Microbacterium sp. PM5 TaxID=2014534 RepID=UPI000DD10D43|nr:hypothetical protein [Microbacterium sp. PM5]AXA95466.1 hypothetical protein CEP17_02985 [Microbacterium sp. PM5]
MIVTLTPRTDFFPVPRVEITLEPLVIYDGGSAGSTGPGSLSGGSAGSTGPLVSGGDASTTPIDLPDGTDAVTLWWRSQGRTDRVRGAISRFFTGAGGFLDLETGFDVPTTYELECFADGVSVGRVSLGTVTLPWVGDPNGVVLQQPLDPSLNATVFNMAGSWPSMTFTADGDAVRTEGQIQPTLIGAGPRQSASDVALDFGVSSDADAARVLATLGTQTQPQVPVWLIRAHQGFLPRRAFMLVSSLTQVDVNHRAGGEWSRFQATGLEVAPPAPALVKPSLRYSDLAAVFGTYTAIGAALPRYSEWSTAWEYAGAAGGS